jgi:hypothetical protein
MTNEKKAKLYAERIAEINRQIETGTLNFEQARLSIDTYAAPQRSSTPPAYPTSALPAGGGMQGSGGMGVQGYNTGGVIRMQDGRQTPSNRKDY